MPCCAQIGRTTYWIVVEFANGERDTVLSCYVRLAPETASIS